MDKSKCPYVKSDNPMDYVKCALAIEVLAYHNKNFLHYSDDKSISEQIQVLLEQALERSEDENNEN